jgi:hypothetical protein
METKTCPHCGFQTRKGALGTHIRFMHKEDRAANFWAKVQKDVDGCWIWQGAKHFRGYGACAQTYGDCRAHRVSWLLTNGPIPKGQGVLHKCDTPLCVNPEHLYLGDQKQNHADRVARGRFGHRYQPVETLLHPHLSQRGKLTKIVKQTCPRNGTFGPR